MYADGYDQLGDDAEYEALYFGRYLNCTDGVLYCLRSILDIA